MSIVIYTFYIEIDSEAWNSQMIVNEEYVCRLKNKLKELTISLPYVFPRD